METDVASDPRSSASPKQPHSLLPTWQEEPPQQTNSQDDTERSGGRALVSLSLESLEASDTIGFPLLLIIQTLLNGLLFFPARTAGCCILMSF